MLQVPAGEHAGQLSDFVSSEKRGRIRRMANKQEASRLLWADLLIRALIMDRCKVDHRDIFFTFNAFGKPFLGQDPSFSFNLSHSGNWVAAAVAGRGQLLGVDIEEIRPVGLGVAKRFFAPKEYRSLIMEDKLCQTDFFYDLWTLKESYLKANGAGLALPLDSFVIRKDKAEQRISIAQTHSAHAFFFRQYAVDPGYKLSVCSTDETFADSVRLCEAAEICDRFAIAWPERSSKAKALREPGKF